MHALSQPRLKLKNRACDLRDLVGEARLPPLRAAGTAESVTKWIIEVQCAISKSCGIDGLTPAHFGLPHGFGDLEEEMLFHSATNKSKTMGGSARQPMADLVQGPGGDAMAAYESAMAAAAATRAKNQRGSNIFG